MDLRDDVLGKLGNTVLLEAFLTIPSHEELHGYERLEFYERSWDLSL